LTGSQKEQSLVIDTMNMICRGQVKFVEKGNVFAQKRFVEGLFGIGV
jgi:hypothetical protein